MNLEGISAKKIIAARLGVPVENFALLRLGGWLENIDSPAFQNGLANTENPLAYDSAFPVAPMKLQATVSMKIGNSYGQPIVIDIDAVDVVAHVNAGSPGEFSLNP